VEAYRQLEVKLAEWIETHPRQMVACSSGTAALHLALETLRSEFTGPVVVPDYTMVACARAVTLADRRCVFVGCRDDLLMDLDGVPESANAVMLVHIYGRQSVPERHYPVQIEDMAELHGPKPQINSRAACWSFYQNKVVHGEEGGAVWFKNPRDADHARQLRCVGFTPAHDFIHIPRGHNYRMANCLAEKIIDSLANFSQEVTRRREVESYYDGLIPDGWRMPSRLSPWVYDLRIPHLTRSRLLASVNKLNSRDVEARAGFAPMTMQPEYHSGVTTPRTRRAYDEVMYLPLTPSLGYRDATRAVDLLCEGV